MAKVYGDIEKIGDRSISEKEKVGAFSNKG
ncbi:hypothetical protein M272_03415 [Vibrio natriegens NBRC 15636 = ATCC 14048 = DSM 759]|nr:hypothetical protein M272_03415 [Vibrio natriegens NBRC 15636 = ATCC 14048 = DSM 759]